MLSGKKILLGITGSIAAYKAIVLVRLLVKEGAEVKVIITPAAKAFVSELTLATLSKNKVLSDLFEEDTWANHVMLGRWADVMLIAPLSCNTLSKMANGLCDNLLLATYLSATCPVAVAPAMDEDMWHHPSAKNNISKIKQFGVKVMPVANGELASGLYGDGRMAETEEILWFLRENFFRQKDLRGKKALVTAGPTYEAIDPVRFVGNHSSGKMGFALAEALYRKGADVTLVTGPTNLQNNYNGIIVKKVVTAEEMYRRCIEEFESCDIAIMSAAVADYTPITPAAEKIKKENGELHIHLKPTKDILKCLGEVKKPGQVLVGFALETTDERENALKKVKSKNADFIILNSLKDIDAGFGKDTNKVTIFDRKGSEQAFEAKPKQLVADDIVDLIIRKTNEKT